MKLPSFVVLLTHLSISSIPSLALGNPATDAMTDEEKVISAVFENQEIFVDAFKNFKISSSAFSSSSQSIRQRRLHDNIGRVEQCFEEIAKLDEGYDVFMGALETEYYDSDFCEFSDSGPVATCDFSSNEYTECETEFARVNISLICVTSSSTLTLHYNEAGICGVPNCPTSSFTSFIQPFLQSGLDETGQDCTVSISPAEGYNDDFNDYGFVQCMIDTDSILGDEDPFLGYAPEAPYDVDECSVDGDSVKCDLSSSTEEAQETCTSLNGELSLVEVRLLGCPGELDRTGFNYPLCLAPSCDPRVYTALNLPVMDSECDVSEVELMSKKGKKKSPKVRRNRN